MSKKFKNIENDEAFKNFKLEDYMPSMPKHEPEESSSVAEQEPVVEAGNLFPILDEPDTSAEQVTEPETSAGSDNEARETEADNVTVERTVARRISSKLQTELIWVDMQMKLPKKKRVKTWKTC